MPNEDLELSCVECGEKFTFTKAEKEQWAKRGYVHTPKRCRRCREERRSRQHKYYHSKEYQSNQNIYRAPSFQDEQKWKVVYRSPMSGHWKPPRREYEITCSKCGEKDTIPFKPTPGRDVYCHKCYEEIKKSGSRPRGEKQRAAQEPEPEQQAVTAKAASSDSSAAEEKKEE